MIASRAFTVLAVATAFLLGAPAPGWAVNFTEAVALHDAARDGDKDAVKPTIEMLTALRKAEPENGEVLAYLGSAYALAARDSKGVVARMRNSNKGLRLLDQALERAPQNFTVRMIRAWVNKSMPAMFDREDDAIKDMLALHGIFEETNAPSKRMSKAMVPIYEHLITKAPERDDWAAWLERARRGVG